MRIVGIDPGVTGAMAVIDGTHYDVADLPVVDGFVDGSLVRDALIAWNPDVVWLEKTHTMPKGGQANFSSGYSQGALRTAVQSLDIPLELVLPTAWKKTQGLIGKDKEASLALARNLFPAMDLHLKKHHDRAEALLIARHGRTINIQEANA